MLMPWAADESPQQVYNNATGGLLGTDLDPEAIKRLMAQLAPLMAQFQPTEQDQRRALGDAIMAGSASLLGTRKGEEWDRLGGAVYNGMGARSSSLAGAQASKKAQLADASTAMGMLDKIRAQQQSAREQGEIGGVYGGGAPGAPAGPAPAGAAPAPSGMPAPSVAAASQAVQQLRDLAAVKIRFNKVEEAKKLLDAAAAMEEKYSTTPQVVMVDGKPTLVRYGEKGGSRTEAGAPEPKVHWGSTGGMTNIPIDERTQQPLGAGMPATMDPSQADASKRGWAGLNQTEQHFQAGQGKPQFDAGSGQWIYPPGAGNPTGAAVTPEGFAKPEKDLNETQAKATAYVNQMENANQVLAGLQKKGFTGKGKVQQADIAGAGAEGIPYVPGTAAIPRWIASDNAQKFSNAELQWTEPVLRFLTGANAPKEEVIRNAATFFPRPGDSDAVIEQKAEARANMEQSIRLAAGRGAAKVPTRVTMDREPSPQEAAWMKMPRGTVYTAPDGSKRVKQ